MCKVMKKNLISILVFVMIMPLMVNAKEYCKVVSGNGKDIGSEIACGNEHFYIIDSNEDEIKMLAKYNLYTGVTIYKEKIEKEDNDSRTDVQYCYDLALSKGGTLKNDSFYNAPGYCFYTIDINEESIHQSENAISAHWDDNENYIYPQVGDVYVGATGNIVGSVYDTDFEISNYYYKKNNEDLYENKFFDFKLSYNNNRDLGYALNKYNEELTNSGYLINSIDLMSLDEINNIVKKNKKTIPYLEWYDTMNSVSEVSVHHEFGSIKDLLDRKYSWIYGTTYWLKTGYGTGKVINPNTETGIAFVDTIGGVCGAGMAGSLSSNGCDVLAQTLVGCGIRPVITISNELQYLIKTETDGKGSIEVVENSLGGETIQFKVSMNKGYKLRSIVIKTDSGEIVEFSEGEITKNDDGTFSIDKNKFTMPFENVTIQAKFELENILKNPKTGDKVLFIIFILVASIGIGTFILKKKEFRYNV